MPAKYIQRVVNLEPADYRTVKQFATEKGLGGKGFSAALRMIIREWRALKASLKPPELPPEPGESEIQPPLFP